MEFRRVRALRGPNVWARAPVLEAWVEFGPLTQLTDPFPGLAERLASWLPALAAPGTGFLDQLRRETDLGTVLAEVALELQAQAGTPVTFGRSYGTSEPSVRRVVVGYQEEVVGRAALDSARRLCLAAIHGQPFDVTADVSRLQDLEYDARLGPNTAPIVRAARARGIPVFRLSTRVEGLYQLGCGVHQHLMDGNRISRTNCVS